MAEKSDSADVPESPQAQCDQPNPAEPEQPNAPPTEATDGAIEPADTPSPVAGIIPSRPKVEYIGKCNEEFVVASKSSELIYISDCKQCKFTITQHAAKCILDSCNDVGVVLEAALMSGTLELIDCSSITLTVNPEHPLPTLTADRSKDLHLHYQQPCAMGSIYTVQCSKLWLYFQEEKTEIVLEDDQFQYVTKFMDNKLKTSLVVREEGGYATTQPELEAAQKKEKDMRKIFQDYLRRLFNFTIPDELPPVDEDDTHTEKEKLQEAKELLASLFSSNIKDEEEKKEIFDSEEEFTKKVDRVVEWMKECKHVIMFTGAGISTSSGIPDYRSGMDTVLETGPGVWELAANMSDRPEGAAVTPIVNALPSPTHMAIVQMQKQDMIKFTVSQNIDGLHRRSGLPPSKLSELHGNTNLETCEKCSRQYLRDFETRESKMVFDHTTSRRCADSACNGVLRDSIINFGEPLPQEEISEAFHQGDVADLCIVLGSSLRVSPACEVPMSVHKRGERVVICNLQKISSYEPDDKTMQVFAKCDDFMKALCQRLDVQIPPFVLHRRARVSARQGEGAEVKVTVTGLDTDEKTLPYSFIKRCGAKIDEQKTIEVSTEPLVLTLPGLPLPPIMVQCQGHYGEPPFQLECPPVGEDQVYTMSYDVLARRNWVISKEED